MSEPLLFEKSAPGRRGYRLPVEHDTARKDPGIPQVLLRTKPPGLPQVSEGEAVRHFTRLSHRNYAVDLGFYPLGSCTMKYNPKINEDTARFDGFSSIHPLQPEWTVQGTLELLHTLLTRLCSITGMEWGTLQPFAGAHGEFTGMKLFKAYFEHRGEIGRNVILVPDSAHGTNPASAHLAGFEVREIRSNGEGMVDPESIREHLGENLAGIMLTNPNTLGLFEREIVEVASLVHDAGGLLYYDGANLNAILGKCRPGDMGFDVVHLNLHKTFSTPHGGGGPGAGPVLVSGHLVPFLPEPDIVKTDSGFGFRYSKPDSIGRMSGFWGNIGVMVRAFTYILAMGGDGLEGVAEGAVLNANYLKRLLADSFETAYPGVCKHEFVISAARLKEDTGAGALDFAKALIDCGVHPPTVYFPLIVHEALMIETAETETRETLESFARILESLRKKAYDEPGSLGAAPVTTGTFRVDEVQAARKPRVRWEDQT